MVGPFWGSLSLIKNGVIKKIYGLGPYKKHKTWFFRVQNKEHCFFDFSTVRRFHWHVVVCDWLTFYFILLFSYKKNQIRTTNVGLCDRDDHSRIERMHSVTHAFREFTCTPRRKILPRRPREQTPRRLVVIWKSKFFHFYNPFLWTQRSSLTSVYWCLWTKDTK